MKNLLIFLAVALHAAAFYWSCQNPAQQQQETVVQFEQVSLTRTDSLYTLYWAVNPDTVFVDVFAAVDTSRFGTTPMISSKLGEAVIIDMNPGGVMYFKLIAGQKDTRIISSEQAIDRPVE